jgi:putative tryptophan/tyrosine transport system substrate-binding protein
MKRREFITVVGGAAAWPLAARAQQSEPMRRIGVLMSFAQTDAGWHRAIATFLEALERLGWVRGRNLQTEFRWGEADPDRIQRYATELVGLKPDLILCQATPTVAALQRTTRTLLHHPAAIDFPEKSDAVTMHQGAIATAAEQNPGFPA